MNPKFNINEFEKLTNKEIIFECEICKNDFKSTKKYVRRFLGLTKCSRKPSLKYCSITCRGIGKRNGKCVDCKECGKSTYRPLSELNNNENIFCSNSCKGINWNKNKKYGFNRSKIEIWIESELKSKYMNIDILFNDRNILKNNYELDIYIPSIRLAFEINGIFHYKPIFGEEKLKIIEYRDIEKYIFCKESNIELITIDISEIKKFNKIKGVKYLEFIINEIDKKMES